MCSSAGVKTVKEEKTTDSVTGMQVLRSREPEHFLLKVESFSEFGMEKYESNEFDAGGYKWRLILYPTGDKARNGSNHISLYLSISTQNLPTGWNVEADFSLFVYNNISEKYLTYKLADKTRFNWLKTESGFGQLIPLDEFKEPSNGYLFGDTCVFGAEIYVTGFSVAKRQTLSWKKTDANIFTWTIGNFSKLNDKLQSEKFVIGDILWYLQLYPKGFGHDSDKSISVYIIVADDILATYSETRKLNAEYKLRIRNQLNANHLEKQGKSVFSYGSVEWGFSNFMPISDANEKLKGFLKNDTLVAEFEITKVYMTNTLK